MRGGRPTLGPVMDNSSRGQRSDRNLAWLANYYFNALRSRVMLSVGARLPAPRKPKLVVLDPELVATNGHYAEILQMIASEVGGNCRLIVYSNLLISNRLLARFLARPIFHDTLSYQREGTNFDEMFNSASRALAQDLRKIEPSTLGNETICVMHSATIFQLGGLARWYEALPASLRPRLFIEFHFPLEQSVQPEEAVPNALLRARAAASSLANAGNVRFAATSDTLAAEIARVLDRPCTSVPFPVRWPMPAPAIEPEPNLAFGFFGGLRIEKGAALLPAAFSAFLT